MSDKQHNINVVNGTVTISTPAANGTDTQTINGLGRWVDFTTANMEDTDSTNFVVTNEYGGTVFASGTKAESTGISVGSTFPMHGTSTIVAVGEGTQSADRTISYAITYES